MIPGWGEAFPLVIDPVIVLADHLGYFNDQFCEGRGPLYANYVCYMSRDTTPVCEIICALYSLELRVFWQFISKRTGLHILLSREHFISVIIKVSSGPDLQSVCFQERTCSFWEFYILTHFREYGFKVLKTEHFISVINVIS